MTEEELREDVKHLNKSLRVNNQYHPGHFDDMKRLVAFGRKCFNAGVGESEKEFMAETKSYEVSLSGITHHTRAWIHEVLKRIRSLKLKEEPEEK